MGSLEAKGDRLVYHQTSSRCILIEREVDQIQKGSSAGVRGEGCHGEQTLKHVWCHQEDASLDNKHFCERLGEAEQACSPTDA